MCKGAAIRFTVGVAAQIDSGMSRSDVQKLEQWLTRRGGVPPGIQALLRKMSRSAKASQRAAAGTPRARRGSSPKVVSPKATSPKATSPATILPDRAGEGLYTTDSDGRIIQANTAAAHMLGFADVPALLAAGCKEIEQRYVDAARRHQLTRLLAESGRVSHFVSQVRRPDGSQAWVEETLEAQRDDAGAIVRAEGIMLDVTHRCAAEHLERDRREVLELVARDCDLTEVLNRAAAMLQSHIRGAQVAVWTLDDHRLNLCGAAGLPAGLTAAIAELPLDRDASPAGHALAEGQIVLVDDLAAEQRFNGFPDLARHHGLLAVWSAPVLGADRAAAGLLECYFDSRRAPTAAELELLQDACRLAGIAMGHHRLRSRLTYQAQHDPLTGLPNRVLLEDRLRQALAQASRNGQMVGVYFIDVDGFKVINETLGHHSGDLLLQQVAARLRRCLRETDTLARMGGDEFTLVTPDLGDRQQAIRVARRMLDLLKAPFVLAGHELFVSASIGIAISPHDGRDCAIIQQNADTALYRAKSHGRNTFECFEPGFHAGAMERLELEGQLRRALDAGELQLQYQPLVSPGLAMVGLEALIRWRHPVHGMISPGKFIPIAEEGGLIVPIGAWVLKQACLQARHWQQQFGVSIPVSINVSPLQFSRPGFLESVADALRGADLAPGMLCVEITEGMLMLNTQEVRGRLVRLRELGVAVAIDDFGTGYSSLSYLHQLPLDTLKIDRSFVKQIGEPDTGGAMQNTAVVRAVAAMARNLGLKVVAEGVETDAQREFFTRLGCDALQGFLFSPAVDVEHMPALLKQFAPAALPADARRSA